MQPHQGADPVALTERLRGEVARLLDEDDTGWYALLRRAADGATPSPAGPEVSRWRRVWAAIDPR